MSYKPTNAELLSIFAHRHVRGEIDAEQLWNLGNQALIKDYKAQSLLLGVTVNAQAELSARVSSLQQMLDQHGPRGGAARKIQSHYRGYLARKVAEVPAVSYCGGGTYPRKHNHPMGTFWEYPADRKLPNKEHDTHDVFSFCKNCVCVKHNRVTTQWRCQGHTM